MMRSSLVAVALLTAGSLPAQFTVADQSLARKMSRVVWYGMSGEQRLSVEYGPARWRPEYHAFVAAGTAGDVIVGTEAWATLQSGVDLRFGDKLVPHGRWYLGVHRDDAGSWGLTLMSADEVDAGGLYLGRALAIHTDVRVPMRFEQDAEPAEDLTIALATDRKQKKHVELSLAWGTYRLRLDLLAEVDDRVHPDVPAFVPTADEKRTTTSTGLQYEQIHAGAGRFPAPTDAVSVHYTAWLADGTIFDSSHWGGQPSSFPLQHVVKGLAEGMQLMQPGATFQFTIPPALGFGERSAGPLVPPHSTLVFRVTLLAIED